MKPKTMPKGTTALAGWFGSNRMLASHVGTALEGCKWVGVLFAGGMSELPHITARTIVVNDLHRHIINLARVVADDEFRPILIRRLKRTAFHPDELKKAQEICQRISPECEFAHAENLALAEAYFICCWMNRAGKSGIDDEFNGRPAVRWNASGGDSAVRYQSAIRALATFARTLRRCTFETMDAFDFLARCEDAPGHGIYADPPFPGAGRVYRHNAGRTEAEETDWHQRLRVAVSRFQRTRVVLRFYDHPMIRTFYPNCDWQWNLLTGRKQSNEAAAEVLLVRNAATGDLFT